MAVTEQLTIPRIPRIPRIRRIPRVPGVPRLPAPASRAPMLAPRRSGLTLATQARYILSEASAMGDADERFRLSHLAALRTAAALFADRARPAVRRRPTNAWVLLVQIAPELGDWSSYFAAGATKRAAIEAGAHRVVTQREADDLVRAAAEFLNMVEVSLGVFATSRAS
jgi:hypothetical protein